MQTGQHVANVGSRLKRVKARKAPSEKPAFQPYRGKPAVRNDRGDRGDVGIIRSPVRASILPDCGGRGAILVPTATIRPMVQLQGTELQPPTRWWLGQGVAAAPRC